LSAEPVGFVGLGNMGGALATNLVAAGHSLVTFDVAGPERNPVGAAFAPDLAELAAQVKTVVLSLPDGDVSASVIGKLIAAPGRRITHVVDTSTTGVEAARRSAAVLSDAGIGFVDAPVSGGAAGARARTLLVMYAAPPAACAAVEPVLAGLSDRRRLVGDEPGQGQALKLANNFLSATALAAASEAISFGVAAGLSMDTMLDVINLSSGQSAATRDKFVEHVATGRYASGFANTLMAKDVQLYLREAGAHGAPTKIGDVTADIWRQFAASEPGVDFTRIYPHLAGS
jgi:3-hydroxyisobutyrate dehydrogenase